MAENVNVEVAINLDHGQDIAFVKQCLHEGFSSVMMDASMHPLENIAITKEIVQFAQAYNASVEAEVGDMGAVAGDQYTSDAMYTDPEEAIHFIRATGVDCLALSYGSSHGDYPEGYRPAFRFDIVQTIKEATDLPLVLHGGSGAGRENILRSVALGINKINVGADFMKAQRNALHQQLDACPESDYPTLIHQTIEAGKAVVKEYIELSGSKQITLKRMEHTYMLINMKQLLTVAKENQFAVGAFNVADSNFYASLSKQRKKTMHQPSLRSTQQNWPLQRMNFSTMQFPERKQFCANRDPYGSWRQSGEYYAGDPLRVQLSDDRWVVAAF